MHNAHTQKIKDTNPKTWIINRGTLSEAFPVSISPQNSTSFELDVDLVSVSEHFNTEKEKALSPFLNSGVCVDGKVTTIKTMPSFDATERCWGMSWKMELHPQNYL